MSAALVAPSEMLVRRPEASISVLASREAAVKKALPKATRVTIGTTASSHVVVSLLANCAEFLELTLLFAGIAEAITTLAVKSLGQVRAQVDRLHATTKAITGLDVVEWWGLYGQRLNIRNGKTPRPLSDEVPPELLAVATRFVTWSVPGCPIDWVQATAEKIGRPDLGHRARSAYERLTGFIARHSESNDAGRAAGHAYAEGRLSLDEVATMLSLGRSDAVALLERMGCARHVDQIELDPAERRNILTRLRQDRQARQGRPELDHALVVRDVIATQRIEGLDVRQWMPLART